MNAGPTAAALHARALLTQRRCAHCAELIGPRVVLAGGDCPRCEADVHAVPGVDVEVVLATIRAAWARWRWVVYAVVLVAQAGSAWIPVAPAALMFLSLVAAELFLIRRPLGWLGRVRRMTTRFTVRLGGAVITLVHLVLSVLLLPLLGVNVVVVGLVGTLLTVLYLEGALWLVGNRLRREARGPGLDIWEWALPLVLVGSVVGLSFGVLAVAGAALYAIAWLQIPGISDIAWFLLSSGNGP